MPIAPLLRCIDLDATRRHYRDLLKYLAFSQRHGDMVQAARVAS
ncbi:hypothetical protein [Pseudomonas mosselii]|nr:hypothetical protein [Pseudomonas mosselii]